MRKKSIALVAHDNKKPELLNWVINHKETLGEFDIYATGTTGKLLEKELRKHGVEFQINAVQSGPLGGDQQIGAKIVEGLVDFLIFFWDPLEPQPHDPDVKALLRIAVTWDIPFACNKTSADFIFGSPKIKGDYTAIRPNYDDYKNRYQNK